MAPRKASVSARKREENPEFRVIAQTGREGRAHFSGNEADARDYLARNFPRPHVDEFTADPDHPVHDVKLVGPGGVEQVYNHGVWTDLADYNSDADDDEDSLIVSEGSNA